MTVPLNTKPHVCFEFEVEKIIGVSSDGSYQVQWAPSWISKFHLVGCEHLIQEFLKQQSENINHNSKNQLEMQDLTSKINNNEPKLLHQLSQRAMELLQEPPLQTEIINSSNSEQDNCQGQSERDGKHHHDLLATNQMNGSRNNELDVTQEQSECEVVPEPDTPFEIPDVYIKLEDDHSGKTQKNVFLLMQESNEQATENDVEFDSTSLKTDASLMVDHFPETTILGSTGIVSSLTLKDGMIEHQNKPLSVEKGQSNCDLFDLHHSKNFSWEGNLDNHMRGPAGEWLHSCDHCGYTSTRKSDVTKHRRIHTGEKPYTCNTCGKSFARKTTLKDHLRVHSGEKPFICDVCSKSFRWKSDLNKHILSHTGVKPYSCSACEITFVNLDNRNHHSQHCLGTFKPKSI